MDELTRKALVEEMENIIEDFNEMELSETDIEGLNGEQLECVLECLKYGRKLTTEVCEWKCARDIMDNTEFKVQCFHNPLKHGIVPNNFAYQHFKFCPYCGRRIVWQTNCCFAH